MQDQLEQIGRDYQKKISQATSLKELDDIFLSLFGKKGVLTLLPKDFPKLSEDALKKIGYLFNQTKTSLEDAIVLKRASVREQNYQKLDQEKLDLETHVELKTRQGHLHPNTQFQNEIVKLFYKLGFQLFEAPHIDTDFYNFESLNIPQEHPARDLWDTLYIDVKKQPGPGQKLLLRTHTSNSQIRIMKQYQPPTRMMVLGRCFRYENLDPRHEHTFDQFELVYIDKGLSMANFQYLSEYFLKSVLKKDAKVRLRPKYYPFTEPSVGMDGECIFCNGQGCKVCGETGWLELGGGGMIHPQVLKNGGIDPNIYSGIAWGPGLQRIMMMKYQIDDIRSFLNGNLKFLQRF